MATGRSVGETGAHPTASRLGTNLRQCAVQSTAAPAPLCGTGNAVADMMTRVLLRRRRICARPVEPDDTAGNPQTHVFNYFAPYAEDDWKVTQKLTINFGLRWDFRAATYEEQNHFFWLDTRTRKAACVMPIRQLTTDGVAPGVGVNGGPILRYCGKVPRPGLKSPFAPRFGINYRAQRQDGGARRLRDLLHVL